MIEFQHVTKSFKDNKVLSDISLTIEDGELVAIIGSSGCGKTTTLKMINRLIRPTVSSYDCQREHRTDPEIGKKE